MRSVIAEKPKLGKYGWTPSTSRFTDTLINDTLNVLIDHILLSQHIKLLDLTIWNPYMDHTTVEKNQKVKALKSILKNASDHYPVSVIVEL